MNNQTKINRDEIAKRAHELWNAAHRPGGRDLEFWLQAEAELLAAKQSEGRPKTRSPAGAKPRKEFK
jgi:hypothetical protein